MDLDFQLPEGLIGRFGVVKLWPEIKNAEDECIARLKIAATALGLECLEVSGDGTLVNDPTIAASKDYFDFVIHLHFDTPKLYDAFSFVALWNPLNFYREWGYGRTSRNLTSHDDFISCSSDAADDHVRRMIRSTSSHKAPKFKLYHSTAAIMHPPSLGDGKLAYAGINWDALRAGQSRHQEVLKRLDPTGMLRIYGPHMFMGVQVWAGYESYVTEVPFDGVSMVNEISKAGAALVLSSQAHKDAGIMSNRLFETLAAGALVICDENPFAKRFFGDCLLYIDSRDSIDKQVEDIKAHLQWASENPDLAIDMISRAQAIMTEQFTLVSGLRTLYEGLIERKNELGGTKDPSKTAGLRVRANYLMPDFSDAVLSQHIASATRQDYPAHVPTLVVDAGLLPTDREAVDAAIARSGHAMDVLEVKFYDRDRTGRILKDNKFGTVVLDLIRHQRADADAFMVIAPNESLLHNHVRGLAGALIDDASINCAATAAILKSGDARIQSVHEVLDFGHVNRDGPPGYGRFIFRMAAIPDDIDAALPYLAGRPLAVLVGENLIHQQLPASVTIDMVTEFPTRNWNDIAESDVIRAYSPKAFNLAMGALTPEPHIPPVVTTRELVGLMTNRHWLTAQFHALRQHGFAARFKSLRNKMSF